jgi:hypothetical protein
MSQPLVRVSTLFRLFTFLLVASAVVPVLAVNPPGQRRSAAHVGSDEPSPLFRAYRGIELGMTADDVRKKLGDPRDKSEEQDFFVFTETESAQVVYDKTHKVIAISADFLAVGAGVLTAREVFGSDIEAKADGSLYRMVRYPKAGYWLSYNRTGGASPLTTVTLQKIH